MGNPDTKKDEKDTYKPATPEEVMYALAFSGNPLLMAIGALGLHYIWEQQAEEARSMGREDEFWHEKNVQLAVAVAVFGFSFWLMSELSAPDESSGGGQDEGSRQEERVRQRLEDEAYTDTPYGVTEADIRQGLGMKGRVADNVRFNPETNQWVIAESKGTNIAHGFEQLENTAEAFLQENPSAATDTELRIYTKEEYYNLLNDPDVQLTTRGGYLIKEGYLGYNETIYDANWNPIGEQWKYSNVKGMRIKIEPIPKVP